MSSVPPSAAVLTRPSPPASPPTNYTDTVPAGMNYYYVVSAICGGVETPNSPEATVTLPYPWMSQDVGAVGFTGSAIYSNGVFTVTGSGDDIWNTADAFRFVYMPVTGNCTMIARVASVQNIDPWSKAGVMIRESSERQRGQRLHCGDAGQRRDLAIPFEPPAATHNNNTTGLSAPYWVKLVRSGNTFTGYCSPDGADLDAAWERNIHHAPRRMLVWRSPPQQLQLVHGHVRQCERAGLAAVARRARQFDCCRRQRAGGIELGHGQRREQLQLEIRHQ